MVSYTKRVFNRSIIGLPLIAYYPAERFVQEVNFIKAKCTRQHYKIISAYDLTAIPYTTFARFLNGCGKSVMSRMPSAHTVRRLIGNDFSQQNQSEVLQQLQQELMNHPKQLSAPNLYALKKA